MNISNNSIGQLPKQWVNINGKELLIKGNSTYCGHKCFEPYSEAIASIIADVLKLEHVHYGLVDSSKFPDIGSYGIKHLSYCEKIKINEEEQLVSLYNLMVDDNGDRIVDLQNFLISNNIITKEFANLIRFDAIIGNIDRHLKNIMYIKNIHNNSIRLAPIFDNGQSLLSMLNHNELKRYENTFMNFESKPIRADHKSQLKWLSNHYMMYKHSEYEIRCICEEILYKIEYILAQLTDDRAKAIRKLIEDRLWLFL